MVPPYMLFLAMYMNINNFEGGEGSASSPSPHPPPPQAGS